MELVHWNRRLADTASALASHLSQPASCSERSAPTRRQTVAEPARSSMKRHAEVEGQPCVDNANPEDMSNRLSTRANADMEIFRASSVEKI